MDIIQDRGISVKKEIQNKINFQEELLSFKQL